VPPPTCPAGWPGLGQDCATAKGEKNSNAMIPIIEIFDKRILLNYLSENDIAFVINRRKQFSAFLPLLHLDDGQWKRDAELAGLWILYFYHFFTHLFYYLKNILLILNKVTIILFFY
jgi:hypothetical protein